MVKFNSIEDINRNTAHNNATCRNTTHSDTTRSDTTRNNTTSRNITRSRQKRTPKKTQKSGLGFCAALSIAASNIMSKKLRTALTVVANSVGIVGIALALGMYFGITTYINGAEAKAISSMPITVVTTMEQLYAQNANAGNLGTKNRNATKFENRNYSASIKKSKNSDNLQTAAMSGGILPTDPNNGNKPTISNIITEEYAKYIKNVDRNLVDSIEFIYALDMHFMVKNQRGELRFVDAENLNLKQLPSAHKLSGNYELLAGENPLNNPSNSQQQQQQKQQQQPQQQQQQKLTLVANADGSVDSKILEAFGIELKSENGEYLPVCYDDILGKTMRLIDNDNFYIRDEDGFFSPITEYSSAAACDYEINSFNNQSISICKGNKNFDAVKPSAASDGQYSSIYEDDKNIEAVISSIIRINDNADNAPVAGARACVAYTEAFLDLAVDKAYNSQIASSQRDYPNISIIDGSPESEHSPLKLSFGAYKMPIVIIMYPSGTSEKQNLLTYLDNYNASNAAKEIINYTDTAGKTFDTLKDLSLTLTIALIAFAAIILAVSSVMTCVVVYVSVLERTAEIGLLRALGAHKHDVVCIFNTEAFALGLLTGIIGVANAAVISVPLAYFAASFVAGLSLSAFILNPLLGLILCVFSGVLTLFSGLFPAYYASKKPPAKAIAANF